MAIQLSRSFSSLRAWFSSASRPVSRSSWRWWWPASTTFGTKVTVSPFERALDLHLGDVEAEVVQPADPAVDVVVLARRVDGLAGQLLPQAAVARADLQAELDRVHRGVQRAGRLQVQQLAADVHPGELEVVVPLPGAELRMQITGLGVHQIGGVGARVPPEQRVGQRAVAPGEPGQVQPHQQHGQRVHAAGAWWPGRIVVSNIDRYGSEPPRCRVTSTGSSGVAVRVGAPGDHGERVDGGDAEPVQVAQQLVLAHRRAARRAP